MESNRLLSRLAAMHDASEEFSSVVSSFRVMYPAATTENLEAMAYTQIVSDRTNRAQEQAALVQ